MSPILIGILGLVCLFLLLGMGMHIAIAMVLVSFIGYAIISGLGPALSVTELVPYSALASYTFSVFPLFLLMGEFSSSSGIMRDIYRTTNAWIGHLHGGLAMATIVACGAFAAVCGSSGPATATMCRIALPEMLEYDYDPGLAVGSIAAGGPLATLIPPSLGFIIYGVIAEQSIGKLFVAGVLPGILEISLFMSVIFVICKRKPALGPRAAKSSWRERMISLKGVWGIMILFALVLGSIWLGVCTPTEAGALGALGSFLIALARRRVTRQNILPTFLSVVITCGMTFVLMIGASFFTYFVSVSRLPIAIAEGVNALSLSPIGVLGAILFVYLILGCLLDPISLTLITLPIFVPIVSALGLDLIWFGVLTVVMVEIGLITPPIGMNAFMIHGMVPSIPLGTIFRGIIPFFVADCILVAILVAFPQISTFLPNTMT